MDSAAPEQEMSAGDGRDWTADAVQLLEDWHKRCYAAQSAHYASADRFRLLNYSSACPPSSSLASSGRRSSPA